jgi:hypothetical protein
MKALQRIIKFIRLPLKEKLLMGEAVFYMIWYSFLIYMVPFRWWESNIGKKMQPLKNEELNSETIENIKEVRRAVFRANILLKGLGKCFAVSLTLKHILKKQGISTTLVLGINKDSSENMNAHSWLIASCRNLYDGKDSLDVFTRVLTYT